MRRCQHVGFETRVFPAAMGGRRCPHPVVLVHHPAGHSGRLVGSCLRRAGGRTPRGAVGWDHRRLRTIHRPLADRTPTVALGRGRWTGVSRVAMGGRRRARRPTAAAAHGPSAGPAATGRRFRRATPVGPCHPPTAAGRARSCGPGFCRAGFRPGLTRPPATAPEPGPDAPDDGSKGVVPGVERECRPRPIPGRFEISTIGSSFVRSESGRSAGLIQVTRFTQIR